MDETNLKFDRDSYDEVINGSTTFKSIAKHLYNNGEDESRSILIGWTDGGYDHRDILFTYRVLHTGNHQRGMRWCHFFVGIVDYSCYGFTIELCTDNRKGEGYLMEKLRFRENNCDKELCKLIDGVIHELDLLEGNVKPEKQNNSKSKD